MAQNPLKSYHLVTAASLAANVTSAPQAIEYEDNIGLQLIWTGTPVGTIDVKVSINYNPVDGSGTFTSLTLSPAPSLSGSAGDYYIDLNQIAAPWVRVYYTRGSGTGTLDVWLCGKGV